MNLEQWNKLEESVSEWMKSLDPDFSWYTNHKAIRLVITGLRAHDVYIKGWHLGGEDDKDCFTPYISVSYPGRPEHGVYQGQLVYLEKIANKHDLDLYELVEQEQPRELYDQAMQNLERQGYTPQYLIWKKRQDRQLQVTKQLRRMFYRDSLSLKNDEVHERDASIHVQHQNLDSIWVEFGGPHHSSSLESQHHIQNLSKTAQGELHKEMINEAELFGNFLKDRIVETSD